MEGRKGGDLETLIIEEGLSETAAHHKNGEAVEEVRIVPFPLIPKPSATATLPLNAKGRMWTIFREEEKGI